MRTNAIGHDNGRPAVDVSVEKNVAVLSSNRHTQKRIAPAGV